MLYSNVALVIEGGGMRSTYTAGLVASLMEANMRFPFVSGVSAGVTVATSLISNDIARLRRSFVDVVAEPGFGGMQYFLRHQGYFNARFIYENSCQPGAILDYNYKAYEESGMSFAFGTFRRDDGGMRWWGRQDVASTRDLARICRASSSLPFLMPPTWIDGTCYVDGGLGESIPITPAWESGYHCFFVIRSRAQDYRKTVPKRKPLSYFWLRRHPYLAEAVLTRPLRYNAQLDVLTELQAAGKAYVVTPEAMPVSRATMDQKALAKAYAMGLSQGRRDRHRWQTFLEGCQ